MALTDTKLLRMQPQANLFQVADGSGLFIAVHPTGKKVWRMQYRIGGRTGKKEKVTLGEYPAFSLSQAREWRDECRTLVSRGQSPARAKREGKTAAAEAEESTVRVFADRWFDDVIRPSYRDPRNVRRILDKDVLPAIGAIQVSAVRPEDVLRITDAIKARGADQMALHTRNTLKRLFAYAIARGKTQFNPAAAIEARFIATARSRDVALSPPEIGKLLRGIYQSSIKRQQKLALHVLILCMVRKSELLNARWGELNFDKAEWSIPAERMKKDKPHLVPLSHQAVSMLQELRELSFGSEWVLPSRNDHRQPVSKSTLNCAVKGLDLDIQDFVIHDFRRTASTLLHEEGFNSDWVEKALAHEQRGVRGVYNRAEYLPQRREMLQWWADFVDATIDDGREEILSRLRISRPVS